MTELSSYDYFKRKSKAEMRRELIDNGLWKDFVKAREALKENGETVERAWRMAFESVMSPFDQRFDDKEVIEYVDAVVSGDVLDPEEEEEEEAAEYEPPPQVVMDVIDTTAKPVRPAAKKKKIGSVSRRPMRKHDVSKETFDTKTCSTPKTVEWVAANIRVGDVQAVDAPSSEAWSMLCWVKSSPQAEAQFWGQIYTKLMPTRQQLDQEDRMKDDGRTILSLIDRMREIRDEAIDRSSGTHALEAGAEEVLRDTGGEEPGSGSGEGGGSESGSGVGGSDDQGGGLHEASQRGEGEGVCDPVRHADQQDG